MNNTVKIRIGVAMAGMNGEPFSAGTYLSATHVLGYIEQELAPKNITVEWDFFGAGGIAVSKALAENKVDFAWQGDLPSIMGYAAGLKTRMLMATEKHSDLFIVVNPASDISNLADLRGKTIACSLGTSMELQALRILESANLHAKDVTFVELEHAQAIGAVATQQVDAAFAGFWCLGFADQGAVKIIYSTEKEPTLKAQACFLVRDEFIKNNPATVDTVVYAMAKGAHWASLPENFQELCAIWAKIGAPAEVFLRGFMGRDLKSMVDPTIDDNFVRQYADCSADATKYGFTEKRIDVDAWIEKAPISKALTHLNLKNYW